MEHVDGAGVDEIVLGDPLRPWRTCVLDGLTCLSSVIVFCPRWSIIKIARMLLAPVDDAAKLNRKLVCCLKSLFLPQIPADSLLC